MSLRTIYDACDFFDTDSIISVMICMISWMWRYNGVVPSTSSIGLEPWTSIFQFRWTKSRIPFDNIFWYISLLSSTKKKFPKVNLYDSELMTLCTFSWETTTKDASSHTILWLMVENSNGDLNYCIVRIIECGRV